MAHKLIVSHSDDGRRLDKVIRSIWPGLPLSVVMKGIRTGSVRLDSKKASCDVRVSEGQEIYVPWESPREAAGEYRYRRTLPVLFRDPRIWAVNKPENLLVQPDRKDQDKFLTV
jgi:23S rRNA pseudouridine955/2504/2580 synthase